MPLSLTRNTPLQNYSLNLCISVPQKVSELKAGGGGWLRSLRVNWLPPAGDWERYHLLLWNRSALVLNTTLEKDTREYLIHDLGLIPGRQYGVDVIVESGDLQSKTSCTGRTGQCGRPRSVRVQNVHLGSVHNERERKSGNPQMNFTINIVKGSFLVNNRNNFFSSSVKLFRVIFVVNVLLVKVLGIIAPFCHD